MPRIRFDYNNLFGFAVGARDGVTEADLRSMIPAGRAAHKHLKKILSNDADRVNLGLEWARLPYQDPKEIKKIQKLGDEIAAKYDFVISLGIGGSYLGLKAAQDALLPPYYNEFDALRRGRPRVYFEGNNLDPDTLTALLHNIDPRKTFVVVISKSGETTETKAAFAVVEKWLSKGVGIGYGRQIFAITDPKSGSLRKRVDAEQAKDRMSFRSLPVQKGVGGRFSELNVGLLHLAIIGVPIADVLAGAADMARRCFSPDILKNPAYFYAILHTVLYRTKGKTIAVMMPFSETLKSTADWYVQLLAESLGKKNAGRTPIPARGTADLHSIQQNNIEGENNKAVTFIHVEKPRSDIRVDGTGDFISGKFYSKLLSTAEEATEWALTSRSRPNCSIIMPDQGPYSWGALLMFFEIATAFEGELLNVNAFDQPGVEGYKNCMYYKLKKPGLSKDVAVEIAKRPLVKRSKYIL